MTSKRSPFICIGVILIASFNAFFLLSASKIQEWDEARRGVSAYEMLTNGRYIGNTFQGQVDYWSAKPPLGLWLVQFSYRIAGTNRFGLRLPSALSAIVAVIVLIMIARRLYGVKIAWMSGAILATTFPFFLVHSARAGEYDAPVVLLISLQLYLYISDWKPAIRCFGLGLLFGLLFLLKSFVVLVPIGILTADLAWHGRLRDLRAQRLLIGLAAALMVVAPWAAARYQFDGLAFFSRMIDADIFQRGFSSIEGHQKSPWYYVIRLWKTNTPWMVCLVGSALCLWRMKGFSGRASLEKYSLPMCWALIPIIIASCARTRVEWYINPSYPGLALCIAVVLAKGFEVPAVRNVLRWLFLVSLMVSETLMVRKIVLSAQIPEDEKLLSSVIVPAQGTLYSDSWPQGRIFVAQVERRLSIASAKNLEEAKRMGKKIDLFLDSKTLQISTLGQS